ncbi:wd g-beta repeat-containing protein, partial [Cystoisospora suis]
METIEGTQNEISKGFRALQRINTRFRKARAKLYDKETSLLLAAAASRGDPIRGKPDSNSRSFQQDNKLSGVPSNPPTRFRNGQRRWRSSRSSDGLNMTPRGSAADGKGQRRPKTSNNFQGSGTRLLLQTQGETDCGFTPPISKLQGYEILKKTHQTSGISSIPEELGEGTGGFNSHSRCIPDDMRERPGLAPASAKDAAGSLSSHFNGIPTAAAIANAATLACPGAQTNIPAYILELIDAHEAAIKRTAFMTPEALALFRPPAWLQKERCRLQQHHPVPPPLGLHEAIALKNNQMKARQSTHQLGADKATTMKPSSRGVRSANQRPSNSSSSSANPLFYLSSLTKDAGSLGIPGGPSTPRTLATSPRGQTKRKPRRRRRDAYGRKGDHGNISQMRLQHIGDKDGPRLAFKSQSILPSQGTKPIAEEEKLNEISTDIFEIDELREKSRSPVSEKDDSHTRSFACTPGAGCFASKTAIPLIRMYVEKKPTPKSQIPLTSNEGEIPASTEGGYSPTAAEDSPVVFTSPSNVVFCQSQKSIASQSLRNQQDDQTSGSHKNTGASTMQFEKTGYSSVSSAARQLANRSLEREDLAFQRVSMPVMFHLDFLLAHLRKANSVTTCRPPSFHSISSQTKEIYLFGGSSAGVVRVLEVSPFFSLPFLLLRGGLLRKALCRCLAVGTSDGSVDCHVFLFLLDPSSSSPPKKPREEEKMKREKNEGGVDQTRGGENKREKEKKGREQRRRAGEREEEEGEEEESLVDSQKVEMLPQSFFSFKLNGEGVAVL